MRLAALFSYFSHFQRRGPTTKAPSPKHAPAGFNNCALAALLTLRPSKQPSLASEQATIVYLRGWCGACGPGWGGSGNYPSELARRLGGG